MGRVRSFEEILEAIQSMNSEKETKLKDYQDKVNYYNSNKNKFMSILRSKKQDIWEAEANKIIKGNVYLSKKWSLDKLQFSIEEDTKRMNSADYSADEEKEMKLKMDKNKLEFNKDKAALDKQIKDDLKALQAL